MRAMVLEGIQPQHAAVEYEIDPDTSVVGTEVRNGVDSGTESRFLAVSGQLRIGGQGSACVLNVDGQAPLSSPNPGSSPRPHTCAEARRNTAFVAYRSRVVRLNGDLMHVDGILTIDGTSGLLRFIASIQPDAADPTHLVLASTARLDSDIWEETVLQRYPGIRPDSAKSLHLLVRARAVLRDDSIRIPGQQAYGNGG